MRPAGEHDELIDGEVVAVSLERNRHALVESDARALFEAAVADAGLACTVFGDGMTVVVDERTVYEPDVVVDCGPLDLDATVAATPLVVVEVLSPGTAAVDTGRKLADHLTVASIRHVLLVDAERRRVVHHRKDAAGTIATALVAAGPLTVAPPGLTLEVAALFAGVGRTVRPMRRYATPGSPVCLGVERAADRTGEPRETRDDARPPPAPAAGRARTAATPPLRQ